ncbi:MAG: aminotransferase class V-fold PLP-dependent enzyme, partial [Firmicutes bacterium]|nr:aminotransferase class V-fold PLP-dependent enzyme [Bacillota bacterium]
MNTPIYDFVKRYADSSPIRLHMPGHKGRGPIGAEPLDITEVDGADSLYEASGIIAESEANASLLFGCPTFYSTEGSSLAIRAMLYLATLGRGKKVLAGRNAHKVFLSAAALLDLDVSWLYPLPGESYQACTILPEALEEAICREEPDVVYITSPDYLGHMVDVRSLAAVCHRHNVLLAVDNAHGAYLRFLTPSQHPMDLGADLC